VPGRREKMRFGARTWLVASDIKGKKMDRKQAYDFFLNALKVQLLSVAKELDNCQAGSPKYAELSEKHVQIQTAMANLDDIANLV